MWAATAVTIAALIATVLCARYFLTVNWFPVGRTRVERFARRQSLAVSVAGGALVVRYLATTRRWRGGGLLLSAVATVALQLLFVVLGPAGVTRTNGVSVSFIALFSGWFAGAVVAEWRIRATGTGPRRSASLRPRRLADYLPRRAWVLAAAAWLLLALTDLAGLVYLAMTHPRGLAPLILWTVADIALAIVLFAVGRRVLTRSQPVATAEVIETDDAIRSRSLHVLAGSALTVGGYLLLASAYVLAPQMPGLDSEATGVLGVICGLFLPLLGYVTATAPSGPIRRGDGLGKPRFAR